MDDQHTTDFTLPEEFENPGVFTRLNNWIKDHSRAITSLIIMAIIVGVGIYAYTKPKPVAEEGTTAEEQSTEGTVEENNPIVTTPETGTASNPSESSVKTSSKPETAPVERKIEMKDNVISVSAMPSEGVTHLGRQALKEYLKANSALTLKPEQKIYIEDYLKDKTSQTSLQLGETKSFSSDLIKEAVDAAQKLNEKQIENLSKYVKLVPELA